MKRKLDLVRRIALFYEEADVEWVGADHDRLRKSGGRLVKGLLPDIEGYGDDDIRYAVAIMVDNSMLVESAEYHGANPGLPTVVLGRRLGWNGHEFLDAVRDEEALGRISEAAERARNWTFQFILEVAKRLALRQIGL